QPIENGNGHFLAGSISAGVTIENIRVIELLHLRVDYCEPETGRSAQEKHTFSYFSRGTRENPGHFHPGFRCCS
ncbi:MAG: hypothetical protein PHG65_05255, partial [Kiritimatiellae bacterium]|nr:hypothetical protein [Kiritimatiellia bacterium]